MPETNIMVFLKYRYISNTGKILHCSCVHPSRSSNLYYEKKSFAHLKDPASIFSGKMKIKDLLVFMV